MTPDNKYQYCYQCSNSEYIRDHKGEICLYCRRIKAVVPKNSLIGKCRHFKRYKLSPIIRRINAERGIE